MDDIKYLDESMEKAMELETENEEESAAWYDEDLQPIQSWMDEIQTVYWPEYITYLEENGYPIEE